MTDGSFAGIINLSFTDSTVIEKVAGLSINGVAEAAGLYSATAAPVGYSADMAYFTGNGTLQVLPEPTSMSALALAGVGSLRRRRMVK